MENNTNPFSKEANSDLESKDTKDMKTIVNTVWSHITSPGTDMMKLFQFATSEFKNMNTEDRAEVYKTVSSDVDMFINNKELNPIFAGQSKDQLNNIKEFINNSFEPMVKDDKKESIDNELDELNKLD